jgi:2-phospho-L-lactate guanylyltransferase
MGKRDHDMNVWAITPVKPLGQAKSRLATVLTAAERKHLAAELLERTVRLLLSVREIRGVLVISRDTEVLALVREWGAQAIQESGMPELNSALRRATQALNTWNAEAVLVVPEDIPLLAEEDVRQVLSLAREANSVVIVPDRREEGTNLLFMRPPGLIPYGFGEHSFAEHQRLARVANAAVSIYRSERAALDLDTPDDLRQYRELAKTLGAPIINAVGSESSLRAGKSHPV